MRVKLVLLLSALLLTGCDEQAWNDPYPNQSATANTLYSTFSEQPNHLDPARSYTDNEWLLIGNIYEPPLDYDYVKRPYKLASVTAQTIPEARYDAATNTSTYQIKIKPGILYQPHPAFAKQVDNTYFYHELSSQEAAKFNNIADFKHTGTRELIAADYVYEIKRLADPKVNSPIFGFMSNYIVGLTEFQQTLTEAYKSKQQETEMDLREYELLGAKVIDKYTYEIKIKGKYPQFKYWFAIPFFAPMPWEAIKFYSQPGFAKRSISLDVYPVGTGAYYLTENNPQRRMVMLRNPNFHDDFYPADGEPEYAGMRLPFIEQVVFSLEKESIPSWDKFLQGYYDNSGISSDNFNSAIKSIANSVALTQSLKDKGIRLRVTNMPTVWYWGFNMLDSTVGGYSDQAKKLRKAINLAFDVQEYITIFANGRGTLANGPIPPEIAGHQPYVPKSPDANLEQAKILLAEAGYPEGRDAKTGDPLRMYFDASSSGDPNEKALFAWIRKQLAKLGVDLVVRATSYNRFSEKMRTSNIQMFMFGWNADYPDPENFLFLFYTKEGKVKYNGMNQANYRNPEYDRLYEQFESMGDNPARLALIEKMLRILQDDSPWIWGYYPQAYTLSHEWVKASKPNTMINNGIKFMKIDPELRAKQRLLWNKPIIWPFVLFLLLLVVLIVPAVIGYKRSENKTGKRLN